MNLVIVESPAKARTLTSILSKDFRVEASMGHIRDLPTSRLGVDIENGFTPTYVIPKEKKEAVRKLNELYHQASLIYIATDPDREGEAIAWHLTQVLKANPSAINRVEFHEITPQAVKEAFLKPRKLNWSLVEAQQGRRVLDRLVGYGLSPLLWAKIRNRLSAGRVQSAALRMVREREKEIEDFRPQEYWTIIALLEKLKDGGIAFPAQLISDYPLSREDSERISQELSRAKFMVAKVSSREISRQPPPPFITSTMQQEASRKLNFSPEQTMFLAQQLYEGVELPEGRVGLITYMRTDSVRVSQQALAEVRKYISEKFAPEYLPPKPREFAQRVKLAQEAHEAIRPTSILREPELIAPSLTPNQLKLYQLIWRRFLASQIESARYLSRSVNIEAHLPEKAYPLRATSSQLLFPGFLTIYQESRDEEEEEKMVKLPSLIVGEELKLIDINGEQHFTKPPPRYTEASLIKALEEKGIGRPSTYAPIISILKKREYVERKDGRLYPTKLGIIVADLLKEYFPKIVDLNFTAQVEEKLDAIARGELERISMLKEFYLPFSYRVEEVKRILPKVEIEEEVVNENCPECGKPMVVKRSRYGKFLSCSDFPNCRGLKPYIVKTGVACPECGGELIERKGKRGRVFYSCSCYPKCSFATNYKPLPQPCPSCGGLLLLYRKSKAKCLKCSQTSTPSQEEVLVIE